ncbi:unnamed protein product [Paramecium sonneborni]|uniref:Uncharacterized protein n=1 Tax=Paramecium sonneborni TaxID=65129 RepID=A0A8S1QX90_9CILI|nr:unnamed protein product [Paramecium sonneborni]
MKIFCSITYNRNSWIEGKLRDNSNRQINEEDTRREDILFSSIYYIINFTDRR